MFTVSLHGTYAPVDGVPSRHNSVSPAHAKNLKAVFGPFLKKGKGSYGDMESTQRWRCSLSEQVRGRSDQYGLGVLEHESEHTLCVDGTGTAG